MAIMTMASSSMCMNLNNLRISEERRLSLWSHVTRLEDPRFPKRKTVERRRNYLRSQSSSGTWPQHVGGDYDKPRSLNYRGLFNPKIADKEKEEAMVCRRTVYDHDDWMRHRSSTRHARHLLSIASSRVILALGPPVFSLTAVAAAFTSYNEAVLAHLLPHWMPLMHVSVVPFSLTAPALALLLVFRTNASYGRFDEARKAWGACLTRTRDVVRQALTWMRSPDDAGKLESFLRHTVAFSYTLKDHIVKEEDLRVELTGLLDDQKEVEAILMSTHRPNYVLQIMSELVHNSALKDMERATMDVNLTHFHDNLGTCERLFKTPIPLSYTRLTSRFLVIWHIALPLALWDQCGWISIPATFLSASALFCIEEVGVLIEEPFSILALTAICNAIKKNVQELAVAHKQYHQNFPPATKPPSNSKQAQTKP